MEEKETIHINLLTELTGNLISEESEWEEEWTENDAYGMPLDGTDLAWYESAIREELNRYGEDDLMQYFSGSASIQEKVKSAVVTIENQEGTLYGCTKLELNEFLNPEELKELGDYITGQYSDGWGEGFEHPKYPWLQVHVTAICKIISLCYFSHLDLTSSVLCFFFRHSYVLLSYLHARSPSRFASRCFRTFLYSSPINPSRNKNVRNVNAGFSEIGVFFI